MVRNDYSCSSLTRLTNRASLAEKQRPPVFDDGNPRDWFTMWRRLIARFPRPGRTDLVYYALLTRCSGIHRPSSSAYYPPCRVPPGLNYQYLCDFNVQSYGNYIYMRFTRLQCLRI